MAAQQARPGPPSAGPSNDPRGSSEPLASSARTRQRPGLWTAFPKCRFPKASLWRSSRQSLDLASLPIGEIRALTGLRGAAALMVLAVHATPVLAPDAPARLAAAVAHGQVAVDLFFVLSGFVLARAQAGLGRAGVPAFLWRRAWRIYPLHAAVLGALAAYVLAAGDGFIAPDFPWSRLLPTLLLVQPFLFHGTTDWNPPDWSIAVEVLCSLGLWPALAALRAIGRPGVVAGVLALAAAANLAAHGGETAGWPAVLRGACGFGFGMALARLAAAGGGHGRWACGTAAELAAGGGFLVAVAADVPAASVALAGWLVLALSGEGGAVSRVLRGRAMAWLGRRSFALYLVHVPLLIPFEGGWAWSCGPAGRLAACGAYLALVAGVAALAEHWVERPGRALAGPARRMLRRLSRDGTGQRPNALPAASLRA
ncbi:MAG: acyltransferase family protein [Janthinobacterium lividum]